jgi:hypothetical protein
MLEFHSVMLKCYETAHSYEDIIEFPSIFETFQLGHLTSHSVHKLLFPFKASLSISSPPSPREKAMSSWHTRLSMTSCSKTPHNRKSCLSPWHWQFIDCTHTSDAIEKFWAVAS